MDYTWIFKAIKGEKLSHSIYVIFLIEVKFTYCEMHIY